MLTPSHRLAALLSLLLVLGACDSAEPAADTFRLATYTGGPYTGTVTLTTTPPGGTPTVVSNDAALTVTDLGNGRARVTMTAEGQAGEPLVLEGTYSDGGATLSVGEGSGTMALGITPGGQVQGGGTVPFFGVTLDGNVSGQATATRIEVVVTLAVTQGNDETPAGTTGRIDILLTR